MADRPTTRKQLAAIWDRLIDAGLSQEEATKRIERLERITSPEAYASDRHTTAGQKLAAAALGAAQGVTFGLSDEAAAGIEAGVRALIPGGKSARDVYREAREAERATRRAAPGAAVAGDIAASLLLPGPGVAQLARTATRASRLRRAGRMMAVLGGTGAVEGAARGETPEGRIAGAVAGGATGAAFGAAPVGLSVGWEYLKAPFRFGAAPGIRALRRAGKVPEAQARILSAKEVAERRLAREMERPAYLRRGQPTPPVRAQVTPEGAVVVPPPPRRPHQHGRRQPAPGADLQQMPAVRTPTPSEAQVLPKVSPIEEVVATTPAEARRQARASATVQQQMARGERGPRGGALVGARTKAEADRMALLAQQLRDLPTDKLTAELDNPMVEDFVKQAARQELDRRLLTESLVSQASRKPAEAPYRPTGLGAPAIRVMEIARGPLSASARTQIAEELADASPSTIGRLRAVLPNLNADWRAFLQPLLGS